MSLTKHLGDSDSPVRAYIDGISSILFGLKGGHEGARAAANALGLIELAGSSVIMPPRPGVDVARAGAAIDFRVRIALGGSMLMTRPPLVALLSCPYTRATSRMALTARTFR